jgi:hypothetical protein
MIASKAVSNDPDIGKLRAWRFSAERNSGMLFLESQIGYFHFRNHREE